MKYSHKRQKRLSGFVILCKQLKLFELIEHSAASYQEFNEVHLVVSGFCVYSLIRNIHKNQTLTVLCSFNTRSYITGINTTFFNGKSKGSRPQQSNWRLILTSHSFRGCNLHYMRPKNSDTITLSSPNESVDRLEGARCVSPQKARLFCLARAARVGEKASPCVSPKPLGFTPPVISRENWAFPNDFTLSNAWVNPSLLRVAVLKSV